MSHPAQSSEMSHLSSCTPSNFCHIGYAARHARKAPKVFGSRRLFSGGVRSSKGSSYARETRRCGCAVSASTRDSSIGCACESTYRKEVSGSPSPASLESLHLLYDASSAMKRCDDERVSLIWECPAGAVWSRQPRRAGAPGPESRCFCPSSSCSRRGTVYCSPGRCPGEPIPSR